MALFLSCPGKQGNKLTKYHQLYSQRNLASLKFSNIGDYPGSFKCSKRNSCAGGWAVGSITQSQEAGEIGPRKNSDTVSESFCTLRTNLKNLGGLLSLYPLDEFFPRVSLGSTFKEKPRCLVLFIQPISRH